MYVKQYGLMRSGTCYTRAFIHENFRNAHVVENILGWKHGPHKPEVSLDGKSWLGSWNKPNRECVKMYSRGYIQRIIRRFQLGEVRYVVTVRNPYIWLVSVRRYKGIKRLTGTWVKQMMAHWNRQHWQWIHAIPEPKVILKYESLRDHPDKAKLALRRVIPRPLRGVHVPRLYVAPGAEHGRVFRQRRDYVQEYSGRMLRAANDTLDPELMAMFGYEFVRKPVRRKRK